MGECQKKSVSPPTFTIREGSAFFVADESIFEKQVILKACYAFTDRAYLFLSRQTSRQIIIRLTLKSPDKDIEAMAGAFSNELIDQSMRSIVNKETANFRKIIVAQAFAEADVLRGNDETKPQD